MMAIISEIVRLNPPDYSHFAIFILLLSIADFIALNMNMNAV